VIAFPSRRNPLLPAAATVALGALLTAQSGWTLRSTVGPPARANCGMAFDLFRGVTVLFGGIHSTEFADTWEWNGLQWTQRTTATTPPARFTHAFAYDLSRGRVLLFGGIAGGVDLSDTWTYDGVDWTQALPAHRPSARRGARMAFDVSSGGVILFGGGTSLSMFLADTWQWNGTDWTQQAPSSSPPGRGWHAMATDLARARIVLFGGTSNPGVPLGDTWEWNGSDWSQRIAAPAPPLAMYTAMVWDASRDVTVQFGGWAGAGNAYSGQTWLFDGAAWRNDPRVAAPPPRGHHTMAYDFVRNRAVLFGGGDLFSTFMADTWEYEPGVIARWNPIGTGCAGTAGVPVLRPAAGSLPVLGTTFVLEAAPIPGSGVALAGLGFTNQQWSGLPLPMNMAVLGMPGCTLHISPDFALAMPIVAGRATLALTMPPAVSLVGTRFFAQGLIADPGVNQLGAVVSNSGSAVVGPF
jgi:hypothetical protein